MEDVKALFLAFQKQFGNDKEGLEHTLNYYQYRDDFLINNHFSDFSHACGVTKVVFIGGEWVLKCSPESFKQYDTRDDESYQELLVYEDAKAKGLEMFFPETIYAGEICGIRFVFQRRIDLLVEEVEIHGCRVNYMNKFEKRLWSYYRNIKIDLLKKAERGFYKDGWRIPSIWLTAAIAIYGKNKVKQLEKFTRLHQINDLHNENVGFYNEKPILLDFSGFHSKY